MVLPPPATVLEIGMGDGFQSMEYATGDLDANTWDIHSDGSGNAGVDANAAHVKVAANVRPLDDVYVCDIGTQTLPFESNSFNTVMCPEVLEHITKHQWPHALGECWRVAINQLLITVPYRRRTVDDPEHGEMDYEWDWHRWEPTAHDLLLMADLVLGLAIPERSIRQLGVHDEHPTHSFNCCQIIKKLWW